MFRSIVQMKSYRLVSPICLNLMQCGVLLVAVQANNPGKNSV